MTERELLRDLLKGFKSAGILCHKEGDTFGGHKKPFDFWMLINGVFYAVEAKKGNTPLEDHQKEALYDVEANGGTPLIIRFLTNGKHDRNVKIFTPPGLFVSPFFNQNVNGETQIFSLFYEKGEYVYIDALIIVLERLKYFKG